jgi:hypothetical protein
MTEPSDPKRFSPHKTARTDTNYVPLILGAVLAIVLLFVFMTSSDRSGTNVSQQTNAPTAPQTPNQAPNPGPGK